MCLVAFDLLTPLRFNFTLQTFAPSAAVDIVPGARYWLAIASSATDLNIYSDTSAPLS